MFQQAFPQAQIHAPFSREEEAAKIMERYLVAHPNGMISREERTQLTLEIATVLNHPYDLASNKRPQLNRWLRPIGYQVDQRGNNKDRGTYDLFRIIRLNDDKSAVA